MASTARRSVSRTTSGWRARPAAACRRSATDDGIGAGSHRSAGNGIARPRGLRSKNAPSSDAPETPSRIAWCSLTTTAVRSPASPSTTTISHNGRLGSSARAMKSATTSASSSEPPGSETLARWTWSSRSNSGSSSQTGWYRPNGIGTARWRSGRTRWTRCSKTRRIWAYRVSVENSDRRPSGGSRTRTAPTWRWLVPVSRARNIASIPCSVSMPAPARSSRSATAVAEPSGPPVRRRQVVLGHRLEPRGGDRLNDELGDPVAPADLVVLLRVRVDE